MVSVHLWRIYALPRVLYGLEALTCLQSDIQAMEYLQRSILRRIQALPRNTAIPALYCLLGIRHLEQKLDLRCMTLLANVLYTDGTLGQDIAMRQISVKDSDSYSWFVSCNKHLHKYSLPNIYTVKTEFESKSQFKQQVKTKIDSLLSSAEEKKSLSFLNVEDCWSTVDNTVMDVRRAVTKARILTGTYYLQADRDKFQKKGITSMCPLCSATSEDRLHFLTACASLAQIRHPYIVKIEEKLLEQNTRACISSVQLVIDCSSRVIAQRLRITNSISRDEEILSRELCFALHLKRCSILKQLND